MNILELNSLKNSYIGNTIFQSKEEGFEFDLFSDKWILGYKKNLYLDWMNSLDSDIYLDLRLSIAFAANHYSFKSLNSYVCTLRTICNYLKAEEFESWWATLTAYKHSVHVALSAFCKRSHKFQSATLMPLYRVIRNEKVGRKGGAKGILDETTGAYSEIERDNILEALRIETINALNNESNTIKAFTRLRVIVACQLMVAIVRRHTQLVQLKWCDVLRVGQDFKSQKGCAPDWLPLTQHHFSDVEQFHIRTFKGKDGLFRGYAESRSHRLDPNLSELLLQYYKVYENKLRTSLHQSNIELYDSEMKELMQKLPILPDQSLFFAEFDSKQSFLNSVGYTSEAFHLSGTSINKNFKYLFIEVLNIKSDRIVNRPLAFQNNRWRHTMLTTAARLGLSPAQIAAITGVTVEAIIPYLDLKISERIKIDDAYAGNSVIQRFDSVSSKQLQQHPDFIVKNPFDEEMGHKLNPSNCSSCQSKGAAPMGCYPCENFRPLETANHQQYLDKAERKLAINSQSAHPATVKKLQTIIVYLKATIAVCEDRKTQKLKDACDENN